MNELRPELERLPEHMRRLPIDRGYPVPWFVEWIAEGEAMPIGLGKPDFRVMSHERLEHAVRLGLCWVCGGVLGGHRAFVAGPMCAVNRTSAEPPSHVGCAEWSARNCPFLARPHARRRDQDPALETVEAPGVMLARNPGVALVWGTREGRYKRFRAGNSGLLFDMGEPTKVSWWAEGRKATRAEIMASIESGLPSLREMAEQERGGPAALDRQVVQTMELLPT